MTGPFSQALCDNAVGRHGQAGASREKLLSPVPESPGPKGEDLDEAWEYSLSGSGFRQGRGVGV